jgi:F-type H+-transporting ATPase subunit epsilon
MRIGMSAFSLKILASDHVFFDGYASQLVINAIDGEVAILPHHEDTIIAVAVGELRFNPCLDPDDSTEDERNAFDTSTRYAITGVGFTQVVNNRVMVFVDTAEKPDDIDEKRAEEALERAKDQLHQKQDMLQFAISQASMSRAISRIHEKHKFTESNK